jgi:hypothetical protein
LTAAAPWIFDPPSDAWKKRNKKYGQTPPSGTTLPTGPGYVHFNTELYQSGDTSLQQSFDRLPAFLAANPSRAVGGGAIVTMDPGVYMTGATRLWGKAPLVSGTVPAAAAFTVPRPYCRGIWGSGQGSLGTNDGTVIKVSPLTCRSRSEGGHWFNAGGSTSNGFVLKNVQVAGTDQGLQTEGGGGPGYDGVSSKLFTNFFAYNIAGAVPSNLVEGRTNIPVLIEDCLFTGSYGNNGAPPGETFNCQVYGSDRHIIRRCESDGRRTVGGPSYGAVGFTSGSTSLAEWDTLWAHHCNARTYAYVYFQAWACKARNIYCGDPSDQDGYGEFQGYNGGGFNLENSGMCEIWIGDGAPYPGRADDVPWYINRHLGDKGIHTNHSGGPYTATRLGNNYDMSNPAQSWLKIHATPYNGGRPWSNIWGESQNRHYVSTWIPYGTGPNVIDYAPEIDVNGVQVSYVWVRGGIHRIVTAPYLWV